MALSSVAVVIPWMAGCAHRERNLAWVIDRHRAEGRDVVLGELTEGPWIKADAIARGLEATDAQLLVLCDADVWSDHLHEAIAAVESGKHQWAMPHWNVRRLTEHGTGQFIAGERETAEVVEEHYAVHGGGIVVVTRDAYERAPLDPRFVSWGQEDKSWARALSTLAGPEFVVRQPLWHLYHPPQERMTRSIGSEASRALWQRYVGASRQPRQMRELIEEGRQCRSTGSSQRR